MNEIRWSNIQKARVSYERGDLETAPGPIEAFFEIAARCNLRCQMCAINYDARYKNSSGSLYENTFAEIWNGDAFRSFRADHASRTRMPEGCGN